ncbi:MAG: carboxypeptidase regulatory-like domain-containing protein [Terriglobia bacterium]
MKKRKFPFLLMFLMLVFAFACSNSQQTENAPSAPVKPTPIDQSTVGEITGAVHFQGQPPERLPILMGEDPICVKLHNGQTVRVIDGEVNDNGTLPNAFVYVEKGAAKYVFAAPVKPVVLHQKGCMYDPHVLGIMVGQEMEVENNDPTTHNIHPMPSHNRQWNISQLPGAAALHERFAHAEIMVPVKCSQHPWMKCYIGVTTNPFYAVTGSDGTYTIKGLPPGAYTIGAWTATFGREEHQVTVEPKQTVTLDFTFKL